MLKTFDRFDNIAFHAGIGDFLAIDFLLSKKEKKNMKNIYLLDIYPIRRCYQLIDVIKMNKDYYNKINFVVINKDHKQNQKTREFYINKYKNNWQRKIFEPFLNDRTFSTIINKYNQYKNFWYWKSLLQNTSEMHSSYAFQSFTNIEKYNLPKKYAVISCYTSGRNHFLNKDDWNHILKILNRLQIQAIVLGEKHSLIPKNSKLILDLTNITSFAESFTIVNNCDYYIGIDSCLSVLAGFRLHSNYFYVKPQNANSLSFTNPKYHYPFVNEKRSRLEIKYKDFFSDYKSKNFLLQ